jgi:REP element-mobilizing transposase RayT
MAQSYASIIAHIIFSTKNRAPILTENIHQELFAYLIAVFEDINGKALTLNCTGNHIHILASLPRDMAPSKIIEKIKTGTSLWIKKRFPDAKDFYWQSGYGCFSVSKSGVESVKKYIANQFEHHKKMTFEDEFRAILTKHGIEYDEKYIWD